MAVRSSLGPDGHEFAVTGSAPPTRRRRSIRIPVTDAEYAAFIRWAGGRGKVPDLVRRTCLGDEAEEDGRVARRLAREAGGLTPR